MKYLIISIIMLFFAVTCFAESFSYWQDQASFYESNYPYCTQHEKAMMLHKAIIDAGDTDGLFVEKIIHRTEEIIIFKEGVKIWPVDRSKSGKNSIINLFKRKNI